MIIQAFPSGFLDTNAYVIACTDTHKALIIDPAQNSASLINEFLAHHNLKPEKILLTHSHWDHLVDTAELKAKYNIPVFVHKEDAENVENPGSDGLPLWISIQGVKPDGFLNDNDIISIGRLNFKVIHTPGHSPGGVCFYCPEEKVLISGDTLFKGSIGNLSFATARPKSMWESLKKLSKLPPETHVFPGHGPATTIGEEKWLSDAENIFG